MGRISSAKILGVVLLMCGTAAGQAPAVEKVEPPSWWAGHSISTVRLMVRGRNFAGAALRSDNHNVKVSNSRVNDAGDHVFFDAEVSPRTRPGTYSFSLVTSAGRTVVPFEILPALGRPAEVRGITSNDIIYLIMTDRFADGDRTNNAGVDRSNPRAWHGGDFRGILSKLDYLQELGITAIWLTPWYDNPDAANQCDKPWCPNTNYHGYHAIDYYAVENHFGSMADLQALVREARKRGIKVIQDQVANHVGIQHPWSKNPPLSNWFSPFTQNSFNNSVLLSPHSSQAERSNLLNGWFNELLPDLNQDEPEVARYLIQNALWWVGMIGIDGIRQDTIQYMPRTFIRDWTTAIRKQYPNLYIVGEVFEEDSAQTAFFQGGRTGWDGIDTNLPSVFDFKLWRTSQEVFTGKKPIRAIRDVLKYDGLYPDINKVTVLANNHDTDRFMSLPGATPEGAMLHLAFVLSTRGIPQIYYGEEIGMTGNHDPDNRKDFPGGFPGDARNAFRKEGRTVKEQQMFDHTQNWIEHRRRSPDLSDGTLVDVYFDDDTYIFARTRSGHHGPSQTLIAINRASESREIMVKHSALHGLIVPIVKDADVRGQFLTGEMTFRLAPQSASAYWIANEYFDRESARKAN